MNNVQYHIKTWQMYLNEEIYKQNGILSDIIERQSHAHCVTF